MKTICYTADAQKDLRKYRQDAVRIMEKIARYAETGAGDAKALVGQTAHRLRVGNFRVIFELTDSEIIVTKIAPRGSVYE